MSLLPKTFQDRSSKIIHPYPVGIGGSSHPSDNSSFTFYFLQHSQFAKACGQSEIHLCLQAKFVIIVTKQLLMISWKHKHLIFSNTKFSLTIIRHAFFILNLLTLLAQFLERWLSLTKSHNIMNWFIPRLSQI